MSHAERGRWLAEAIRRRVAQGVAGALRRNEHARQRLRELGIVDDAWLADAHADPLVLLGRLQQCAREIREQPSLLGELGVSSVDVLCCDRERPTLPAAPPGPDLTVVFTDLEGFTSFTRREGDGEASRLLGRHYSAVDDIVSGRGGRVVKRLGDGHLLTFAQPRAGVLAGLELVEASMGPLRLRAGGHAGTVVVMDDDVLGDTVNVASRVVGAAEGGHSLVTAELCDRAGPMPGVAFGEARAAVLRGLADPVPVCEVRRA